MITRRDFFSYIESVNPRSGEVLELVGVANMSGVWDGVVREISDEEHAKDVAAVAAREDVREERMAVALAAFVAAKITG